MQPGPSKEEQFVAHRPPESSPLSCGACVRVLGPIDSLIGRERNFDYWNTFSVHKWYPPLREFTFETIFVDMSVEDAEAFVAYQERLLAEFSIEEPGETKPMPPYNSPRLDRLEADLDAAVTSLMKRGSKAAFVKLSDRSPKDATTERGRVLDFLEGPLKRYTSVNPNVSSNAVGLPAIYEAMMGALRVTSGKEALQLLLMSFRTMVDLQARLPFKNKLWEMKVVVREWVEFPLPYEFRGFVADGQFNCLSQYYYDCYFPELVKHKDWIERSIRNYWRKLADKVPYRSYGMDFAIMKLDTSLPPTEDLPVKVIELNPFDEYTDTALFKWKLHQRLMHEGPWTFRVVTEEEIHPPKKNWWRKILADFAARKTQATP